MTAIRRRTQPRGSSTGRPTTAIAGGVRRVEELPPSTISVFPASIDIAVAPGRLHRLDRRDADDRDVEPHVLFRLRDLDDPRAGAGDLAGAADHGVGPLHRFDGDDRLVLDDDRLADVERGDGVRHPVAEGKILELLRRRRRGG